jgi:hypothetical protein
MVPRKKDLDLIEHYAQQHNLTVTHRSAVERGVVLKGQLGERACAPGGTASVRASLMLDLSSRSIPWVSLDGNRASIYELIPNMPEHRLLPLMRRFAEILGSSGLSGGFLSAAKWGADEVHALNRMMAVGRPNYVRMT